MDEPVFLRETAHHWRKLARMISDEEFSRRVAEAVRDMERQARELEIARETRRDAAPSA